MRHLLDTPQDELRQWLEDHRHPAYRLRQIQQWIYHGRVEAFSAMTNLPLPLREELAAEFTLFGSHVAAHHVAEDGTEKLLVQWPDRGQVECVLLRDETDRRSICISTQVGCAMGCVFCASGLNGVDRNLTSGEIVEQMLLLARLLPDGERISHIIVMGMGEPLANVDNLLPALQTATAPEGLGISARRVTISTVGIPAAIRRLTELDTRYHLAVSLHAANDQLRNRLVPVNKSIGLQSILLEADRYFEQSGRRLTFEYVLLAGVNDSPEDAKQLGRLLQGRTAMLNLIPYNPVAGLPYETPTEEATDAFCEVLHRWGINVRIRRRKGDKINAACGQLRRNVAWPPSAVQHER